MQAQLPAAVSITQGHWQLLDIQWIRSDLGVMNDHKTVVLLSGGIDSVTALYSAHNSDEVLSAISFDYGSKHNHRELSCAKWHSRKLNIKQEVVCLDFMARLFRSVLLQSGGEIPDGHYESATMKQTVVPFRNGVMLSVACGYAESIGADSVVIGAHSGDHVIYPDCREQFMGSMAEAMKHGTYAGIELQRPFISMSKSEIVQRGSQLEIDYSKTWSCYKGGDKHCGRCGTCVERIEAFSLAGILDPTEYEQKAPATKDQKPGQ